VADLTAKPSEEVPRSLLDLLQALVWGRCVGPPCYRMFGSLYLSLNTMHLTTARQPVSAQQDKMRSTAATLHHCAYTQTANISLYKHSWSRFLSSRSSIGHLALTNDGMNSSVAGNSCWLNQPLPCDSFCADDFSTELVHWQYIDQLVSLKHLRSKLLDSLCFPSSLQCLTFVAGSLFGIEMNEG